MLVLSIIIFGCVLLLVLNVLYKHTNSYRNQFIDMEKFMSIPQDAKFDVVNLGSNQPKFAFDYTNTGVKGMNWAAGPQTLEFDFSIIKKYSKHLDFGATVIIPICLLQYFLYDTHKPNLVKYYKIFSRNEMPHYDKQQKMKDFSYPILFHPLQLRRLIIDVKPDLRMMNTTNQMNDKEIAKDATFWIEGCWNPLFNINIANMQSLSEKNNRSIEGNIRILSKLIQYCIDNDFKPVVAFLPVTKDLREKFSASFIENHIIAYTNQAIGNQDVTILNYLDESTLMNVEYYFNSFFMNKKGRKIFTQRVLSDLKLI